MSKRPRDTNQLAKFIVDLATGEQSEPTAENDTAEVDFALRTGGNGIAAFAQRRHGLFLHEARSDGGRPGRFVDVEVLHPADIDD